MAPKITRKLKTLTGVVVSAKMKNTITVAVNRYVKHPKYKKYVQHTKKYLAHNEGAVPAIGDRVTIRSCRPLSKMKHFIVVK